MLLGFLTITSQFPNFLFQTINLHCTELLVASRIRTWIIKVEGKDADHYTTYTAQGQGLRDRVFIIVQRNLKLMV